MLASMSLALPAALSGVGSGVEPGLVPVVVWVGVGMKSVKCETGDFALNGAHCLPEPSWRAQVQGSFYNGRRTLPHGTTF